MRQKASLSTSLLAALGVLQLYLGVGDREEGRGGHKRKKSKANKKNKIKAVILRGVLTWNILFYLEFASCIGRN